MSRYDADAEYVLELLLLSETVFSSGEKERNLVQNRSLADSEGFVYYHAKSLKGRLKRQGLWLLQQYIAMGEEGKSRAYALLDSMDTLFGISVWELRHAWTPQDFMSNYLERKQSEGGLRGQGIMKLTNLELPQEVRAYFRDAIRKGEFSTHDLIAAQTHIRTQIQLEENGTVKDKMLNTYQAIKKGLVFHSRLFFDEDPSDVLADLARIVYSMERIGANIHRGRGEIESRLLINGQDAREYLYS
ncbi:hypothetical protein F4V43_09555 [Paenibacillus spiritus]|uniref:Uncharacterized protein n=1 Tax=Paenibacillus spiritus TaxID=2496557 RepID=A0A5J5GA11_9BACL|nr:hypothetical protein [Paenibacillus spiritus]KAA9004868.1 hypothetical protein F4V43_09555 [Paenibacillus spiritus]